MRIAARFQGPDGSANGGITAGRLAAYVGAEAVEVTLRRPPPLDTDLRVDASGGTARLLDGDALVAEAVPATLEPAPVEAVSVERAQATVYAGLRAHPFPRCFVCGPERADGLRLAPGPLGDGRVACAWTPDSDDPTLVWAALDCPGGWSTDLIGRPMVLGRMALRRFGAPTAGGPHVVLGWTSGTDGRKSFTASALLDSGGSLLALARATWIALPAS